MYYNYISGLKNARCKGCLVGGFSWG